MATFNVGLCVLCASITVAISIPLSAYGVKHLSDSQKYQIPAKFQTQLKTSGFNTKSNSHLSSFILKDTSDSSEDIDGSGKGGKDLEYITDRMMQTGDFALNDTIDYDSMDLPKSQRLVPDYDSMDLPKSQKLAPDYDSMDLPKSQGLVPDYDSEDLPKQQPLVSPDPANRFKDLSFQEIHERAQVIRISEVKESILSKLRLLAPPNITALKMSNKLKTYPDHIVPKLQDQSDFQQDDSYARPDDFHAKISTVIQFASDFPKSKHPERYPTESIAYFSLPMTVSERNVQKATILIYIVTPNGAEGRAVRLLIADTLYRNKPFINRTVNLTPRGHWEHIDVTQVVTQWAADETQNYGLVVSAMLDGKNIAYLNDDPLEIEREKIILDGDIVSRPHRTPLVKILLDKEQGRYKRSFDEVPLSCDINDRDNRCCRYKFSIEFEELGPDFDFIIEPRRYWANYCAGSCPTYYLPHDSSSKLLMAFQKPKVQRCCTATTKKPLNLLYYNEAGDIMLGEIPDMSIEKCSCS